MAAVDSDIKQEEYYKIAIGQGLYTSELSSNIPDGFSPICYNLVATGDSLENRVGIKRSTVTYKVEDITPTVNSTTITPGDLYQLVPIAPWKKNSTLPAFMWGGWGFVVPTGLSAGPTLNLVRASGTTDANDGFISVTTTAGVLGICQYQDVIYFSVDGDGVKKITAINWATDAVTYSAIASTAGGSLKGLFTFKDRIWGWGKGSAGHFLYFTDLPTVGSQPETWSFVTNRIPFVGPNGAGQIQKVVPLGNKLAVFTTTGFFTLLVEGSPQSWILRILDSKSISTTNQCAFESKGIIYYVNTEGVWATNNLTTTKLSAVIEDKFFKGVGSRIHTINHYEDGLIVSIGKLASNEIYLDRDSCNTFYSKLDPVGWTEWNINSYTLGSSNYRIGFVWSLTDKIPTYLNIDPTVYSIIAITDSTPSALTRAVYQLLIFDGGEDQYVNRANAVETLPVGIYLKTKHFDGGNQYHLKFAKKGYIEVFTSDAEHQFTTSWDIDATIDVATEKRTKEISDFTVGNSSNLIIIPAQFYYRRSALNFRAELQSDDSQIKIKDVTLVQDTGMPEYEQVR